MTAARPDPEGCPPDMAFADLLEGRLAEADAARLREHAAGCDRCRAALDALTDSAKIGMESTEHAAGGTGEGIARAIVGSGKGDGGGAADSGRTIDRKYRLLRCLGQGGMGAVYESEHAGTGRRVAVKLIQGKLLARGGDAEGRFRREARVVGAIDSPHIVEVLDAGEDEATGDLYLVMECLRGEDLQHLVDRVGPLRPDVALRVAAQALAGLAKAHAAGIVHRDIKPANLFLATSEDGEVTVKLLDFGIAKVTADAPYEAGTGGLVRTTDGLLGSPLYMSPEQVKSSGEVDHRTDLWSMGSVLYCALAGAAPFGRIPSLGRLIVAICSTAPPPLREVAPWVPPAAAAIVQRALAIDREDRTPSAAVMLADVRALLPGGAVIREEMLAGLTAEERAAAVPSQPPPRPRRAPWIAAAVAAAAGIAIGAGFMTQGPRPNHVAADPNHVAVSDPNHVAVSAVSPDQVEASPPPQAAQHAADAATAASSSAATVEPAPAPTASGRGNRKAVLPATTGAAASKMDAGAPAHAPGVVEDVPF
jgi:serine/threonine-protein kinase